MAFESDDGYKIWPNVSMIVVLKVNIIVDMVFNCIGCDMSYNNYNYDLEQKTHRFKIMNGTVVRALKRNVRRDTLLKFYRVMPVTNLLYGSEGWTLTKNDCKRSEAAKMNYLLAVR